MGDPAGIGPELALRALGSSELKNRYELSVVGDENTLAFWSKRLSLPLEGLVIDVGSPRLSVEPGQPSRQGAHASLLSIEKAAALCVSGVADAMVTAPVSKAAIASTGRSFIGHTEFLAELTGSRDYAMTFVHGTTRIALVTTHVPVSEVANVLETGLIISKLRVLDAGLREWFGVESPRIAVSALNPHAGEGGAFGSEEAAVIEPAIEEAQAEGIAAHGPYPADSIFVDRNADDGSATPRYDATLMMYHDQATIAAKLLGSGAGVNVTLGLSIVRTSVDHGTAFDIATRGDVPRTDSMLAAVRLAGEIAERVTIGPPTGA
jgi:4-hydroxythreonine-4-phosphate dehydrogenase